MNKERFACRLKVGGMDCPSCEETVRNVVDNAPGVKTVSSNYLNMTMHIEGEGDEFDSERIISEIKSLGYKPEYVEDLKRATFKIAGLNSAEAEHEIRQLLSRANISLLHSDISSETIEAGLRGSTEDVINLITRAGFKTKLLKSKEQTEHSLPVGRIVSFSVALLSLLSAISLQLLGYGTIFTLPLYLITIFLSGLQIFRKGLMAILRLRLDMNSLMTLSVFGAMIIGEWFEGATVVFLGSVANMLEAWSMDKARSAVNKLMNIAPQTALVFTDDGEQELPVDSVEVGSRMIIKPGARVPLDSVVIEGSSSIDQSQVTGESVPVTVAEGDTLFSGSVNTTGGLVAEVTNKFSDSTVNRIASLVEDAQSRRSEAERFIDKFASVYTPLAVLFALLIAFIPPVFLGNFHDWFYRGLVLLVIACPCALVISTPVGIVSGLVAAAKAGVLIKGGDYLERASRTSTVAFDKTGTITYGKPVIEKIHTAKGVSEDQVVQLAASLERFSQHPFAESIVYLAKIKNLETINPDNVKTYSGKGIAGYVNGDRVIAGNDKMMQDFSIETSSVFSESLNENAVVYIARNDSLAGMITFTDEPRTEALATQNQLRESGITTVLLTGDKLSVAEKIAQSIGLDSVHANLLPEQKLEILERIKAESDTTMMVGDGINDAPALVTADIGVAMGAGGTDIALEAADIALMRDDISLIPFIVQHGKRTMKLIRQNILLSIVTKLVFVLLSVFGFTTLWMAVIADTGLSLAVTANSLRLLKSKKKQVVD